MDSDMTQEDNGPILSEYLSGIELVALPQYNLMGTGLDINDIKYMFNGNITFKLRWHQTARRSKVEQPFNDL